MGEGVNEVKLHILITDEAGLQVYEGLLYNIF